MAGQMKKYDGPAMRLGCFGNHKKEGQAIEDYKRPPGSWHGPFMVDYITGGMYKILHDTGLCREQVCAGHGEFARYADAGQIEGLYKLLREERFDEFEQEALFGGVEWTIPKSLGGNANYGPLPAECHWIATHDDTLVKFAGSNIIWPDGCWVVEKRDCERQLVDPDGIRYIAHELLGMPHKLFGEDGWAKKLSDKVAQNGDDIWDGDEDDVWAEPETHITIPPKRPAPLPYNEPYLEDEEEDDVWASESEGSDDPQEDLDVFG
jgi:hypothetical protein